MCHLVPCQSPSSESSLQLIKPCLVHVLIMQGSQSTKTRSTVNYSGRKLRQQKGTGKARVGDASSGIRESSTVTLSYPLLRQCSLSANSLTHHRTRWCTHLPLTPPRSHSTPPTQDPYTRSIHCFIEQTRCRSLPSRPIFRRGRMGRNQRRSTWTRQ